MYLSDAKALSQKCIIVSQGAELSDKYGRRDEIRLERSKPGKAPYPQELDT